MEQHKDISRQGRSDQRHHNASVPVEFFWEDAFRGFGLSEGLARGLQVRFGRDRLTQEGMGIGTAAIKSGGMTYFCREARKDAETGERVFSVDTLLLTAVGSVPSKGLTRLWNLCTEIFLRLPAFQGVLLKGAAGIRKRFHVMNHFQRVPPQGKARFQYRVHGSDVEVRCTLCDIEVGSIVCLMNEMGADWFEKGWESGKIMDAPPSWQELTGRGTLPAFYSEQLDLTFAVRNITVTGNGPWKLFWGREKNDSLCWAGYTIEITPDSPAGQEIICTYTVSFTNRNR